MCAKSDDPLTINQNFRALNIGVAAADGSGLQGLVVFHFLGYTTSHSASRVSGIACEEAWEALDNVDDVDCLSEPFAGGAIYNVTFKQWPIEPMENNFFSHTGNPGLTNFTLLRARATVLMATKVPLVQHQVMQSLVLTPSLVSTFTLLEMITSETCLS